MTAPPCSALAEELARRGLRRLRLEEVRALWRIADPIAAAAEDAHARFRQTLESLRAAGIIALPVSAAAWDRSVTPALPRSITVAGASCRKLSHEVTAWVPELSFAATERHRATLDALRAVNSWFKRNRGRAPRFVPVSERSLEIFGDEKRLDCLRDGETLFSGRLRLADLACERLPPFLIWHPGQSPRKTVLVVENAAAFASFRRFNEEARLWRAVIWGQGNAFCRNHAGLVDIFTATDTDQAVYFGDLDPKGVEILAAVMRERRGDLCPHRGLYAALMKRRLARREPRAALMIGRCRTHLRAVLPDLADPIEALWSEGMVLPQEGYGLEALLKDHSPATEF